jgi:pimeloyl-ACP methyl ester carboxylesterase
MSYHWPEPTFVQTNGIRIAVYTAGQKGKPAVVLSHGWPELAFSWRHQLKPLADAGFHILAPDQRGYGLTSAPDKVEDYDIHHLTADLVGLLDAYGIEKAVFAGHDWGGFVVWAMPQLHPSRVAGVIGLNTPHLPRAPMDPIALMRMAYGEDMYIVFFQKLGVAEAVLEKDVGKTMRFMYRRSGLTIEEYEKRPASEKTLALGTALQTDETLWPGKVFLNDAELSTYVETFKKSGFRGGVNWYRNFTRNWQTTEGVDQIVKVPCLMIMAENDIVLRPSMADNMGALCPDLEKYLVKDSGHWTQQEKPEETTRVMRDWLLKRFG